MFSKKHGFKRLCSIDDAKEDIKEQMDVEAQDAEEIDNT